VRLAGREIIAGGEGAGGGVRGNDEGAGFDRGCLQTSDMEIVVVAHGRLKLWVKLLSR
jgi:hypothetical protein